MGQVGTYGISDACHIHFEVDGPNHVRGQMADWTDIDPWQELLSTQDDKGGPAVQYQNSINVFNTAYDSRVWQKFSCGGGCWSNWGDALGSPPNYLVTSDPIAIPFAESINVFAVASDGALWQIVTSGPGWSGWASLGRPGTSPADIAGNPAVVRFHDSINLFVRGGDGHLYQKFSAGAPWSGWGDLGYPGIWTLFSDPVAIPYGNSIYVFVRASDGGLWYRNSQGPGWSSWNGLVAPAAGLTGNPAAVQFQNSIVVFSRGGDGSLQQNFSNPPGAWSGWGPLPVGVSVAGDPSVVQFQDPTMTNAGGRPYVVPYSLTVLVRGSSPYQMREVHSAGGTWSGANLGGIVVGNPAAVRFLNSINVFVSFTDGKLYQNYATNNTQWGTGWGYLGSPTGWDVGSYRSTR
jgi:hypothetical protein